jgi:hypothetical protein
MFTVTESLTEVVKMAELRVEDGKLVLHLTTMEKVEGAHRDLRVPLSAVSGVEVLDDAHAPVGVRAGVKVGTRVPGVVEVGTVLGSTKRMFAAVHHDTPRGLRVSLDESSYDEWIVGCSDPEAVVARLSLPAP